MNEFDLSYNALESNPLLNQKRTRPVDLFREKMNGVAQRKTLETVTRDPDLYLQAIEQLQGQQLANQAQRTELMSRRDGVQSNPAPQLGQVRMNDGESLVTGLASLFGQGGAALKAGMGQAERRTAQNYERDTLEWSRQEALNKAKLAQFDSAIQELAGDDKDLANELSRVLFERAKQKDLYDREAMRQDQMFSREQMVKQADFEREQMRQESLTARDQADRDSRFKIEEAKMKQREKEFAAKGTLDRQKLSQALEIAKMKIEASERNLGRRLSADEYKRALDFDFDSALEDIRSKNKMAEIDARAKYQLDSKPSRGASKLDGELAAAESELKVIQEQIDVLAKLSDETSTKEKNRLVSARNDLKRKVAGLKATMSRTGGNAPMNPFMLQPAGTYTPPAGMKGRINAKPTVKKRTSGGKTVYDLG